MMTTSVKLPEAKLAPPGEKSDPLRPRIGLWLGPLAFLGILLFLDLDPQNPAATRMVAIVALMAIWWITEAIPLAATALSCFP
jgi:di/tricarboxylate transporter